ncbi:MAG: ImmA/IrrE family metallo-endopeptidase [Gemmatimonadales bacterium]
MNVDESPWRQNFNFAHEVFHLVTWTSVERALEPFADGGEPEWLAHLEKLANHFAAALLLPTDELQLQFGLRVRDSKIQWLDLVELANEFDVSTSALAWRLAKLRLLAKETVQDLLDNPRFQELDRSTMPDRWNRERGEPRLPSPLPERFVRLAFLAYRKGELSMARLAEYLEVRLDALAESATGSEYASETAPALV